MRKQISYAVQIATQTATFRPDIKLHVYPNCNKLIVKIIGIASRSFRVGTHGNGVPIVKCLRKRYGRYRKPFPIAGFCIYNPKFFRGDTPEPTEAPPVLGPRHQSLLGSPAIPLFLFYETTTEYCTKSHKPSHVFSRSSTNWFSAK